MRTTDSEGGIGDAKFSERIEERMMSWSERPSSLEDKEAKKQQTLERPEVKGGK